MLLHFSASPLRVGVGLGSLTFVVNLAAGVLFGAFWAGGIAAVSTSIAESASKRPFLKAFFNVTQRTLCLVVTIFVYRLLGGSTPPDYLLAGARVASDRIVTELFAFFAASFSYFILNSVAVSGAIALSRGSSIRDVWTRNTIWVLGYDMGASSLALLVAWVFQRFDASPGVGKLGFVVVFLPIIAAKHIYAKLSTLQSLYDELDSAYDKLELNVREQLEMMVRSIEARDPYTSGHSRRVAALSKAIATDLGLDAKLVDEIENAALLHDVGKIHAEFAPLLSKEGRLTEDEWEVMKTHAAKSADLVSLFSRFKGNVLDSVRWHHERWDGKGYPDGIVGAAIPLGSRIIMISDTIDAMSTDRPYRKALSFEKVVSELIKYRGIQFDPDLVDSTVNSVTVRRMVSDKVFLAEQITSIKTAPHHSSRPALRSQRSFWEGLRAAGAKDQA
jgi:HD-GYP domain-containing protein (c-di-GMP phosphodiesterase class II)